MNRFAAVLVLTLTLPLAARADEASHRAKAEEMMTLLHTQRMVEQISGNITKQVDQAATSVAGTSPTPATQAKVDNFKKQADKLIDAQLGWDAMKPGFLDVYVKNFTEEQLDAIIAFYKSPAGSALLDKMPTVNSEVTQFGNTRMTVLQPQLKDLFDAFRKDVAPAPAPALGPVPASPAAPAAAPAAAPSSPSTHK